MHFLYIVYSDDIKPFYIGESEQPQSRLKQHNTHYFQNNFTKAANDWKLVLTFACQTKADALYLEKFIKRMKSRQFIEKVMADTSILDDLLRKK